MRKIRKYLDRGRDHRYWYKQAREVIQQVAREHGCSPEYVADIMALTSPRTTVMRNLRVTRHYLRTRQVPPDVIRSTRMALAHYEVTGTIRGPKTQRFALVLKGQEDHCVVDSHLARAFGYRDKQAASKYCHEAITKRVKRMAKREGWTVAQVQAAIWAGYYRSTYPTGNVPTYASDK